MKLTALLGAFALMTTLYLPASTALAAHSQPASTFSTGGGQTTSSQYTNLGIIGQPGIIGTSSSTSYTAKHGFLAVLGDGFKILYPVIAVTPGTLTFTLMATTSGNQTMDISNNGGSTLAWTVAKGTPDSIFSFTPAGGTDSGSVTVTANAPLAPGNYSNILTISGAGISQTAQVQLNLNVTLLTYRLTVTVLSDSVAKGGGTVSDGFGTINCTNTGNNPTTMTGICQADLLPGTSITLQQLPESNSTAATWDACSGTSNCEVTSINANTSVTGTFHYSSMARISNGNGYESLLTAYDNAAASDTISTRTGTFVEGVAGSDLLLNSAKTINLIGGLDAYYAPGTGFTTIQNALKVRSGRLNIKGGVKVHP